MLDWEQDAIDQATEDLADFPLCTWTKVTDSSLPDSNKDWIPGEAATTPYQVRVAIFPPNSKIRSSFGFMPGAEIPDGFARGYMAGNVPFSPTLKDKLVASDGQVYSLEWMDCLKPAGNPLLYTLGLKP